MNKYEVVPRHTKEEIIALLMEQKQHLMVRVSLGVYRQLEPTDKVVVEEWREDGASPEEVTFYLTIEGERTNIICAKQGLVSMYLEVYPAPGIEGCLDDEGENVAWESDPSAIVSEVWFYDQGVVDYYNSLEN